MNLWTAAPDPGSVLRRWAGTGRQQPDWRDSAALTDAVVAIITWLVRTGAAHAPNPQDTASFDAAEAGLDWLDLPRLTTSLAAQVSDPTGGARLPQRSAVVTPRQRNMLAALARAIRDQPPVLDASAPTSGANSMRLLGALAASEPACGEDPWRWCSSKGCSPHGRRSSLRGSHDE